MIIQNGLKTYRKISHPTKRLIGKKNYKKEKKKKPLHLQNLHLKCQPQCKQPYEFCHNQINL